MAEPCWTLTYPNGDAVPHFRAEEIARERAATYLVPGLGAPQPRRLDQPCITVSCGCCEYVFDEDEDGAVHFTDLTEAAGILPHCCWTQQPDGSWRCETCSKGPCDLEADTHG